MSTSTLPVITTRQRVLADRRFYLIMAVASALLIFVGFARSYFLRVWFPLSPTLRVLVHIHGAVFTAWVAYFILQTALITTNRPALHRKLGYLGAFLGFSMILLGLMVAFSAMRLGHGTRLLPPETVFLVGLLDIFSFGLFFTLGWVRRRNRDAHQRLMLLSVIVGLTGAAIGRVVGYGVPIGVMSAISLAFIFAGPAYDFITRRRVHPVYIYGCLFAMLTYTPLRFVVGATPWWHHIAHRLVGQ